MARLTPFGEVFLTVKVWWVFHELKKRDLWYITLSIKILSTKSHEIFAENENFTDQYFHWAILSTNYYIETKVFAEEYFYRLIFWLR